MGPDLICSPRNAKLCLLDGTPIAGWSYQEDGRPVLEWLSLDFEYQECPPAGPIDLFDIL